MVGVTGIEPVTPTMSMKRSYLKRPFYGEKSTSQPYISCCFRQFVLLPYSFAGSVNLRALHISRDAASLRRCVGENFA